MTIKEVFKGTSARMRKKYRTSMTVPEQKYPIIRVDMQMRKGKESNITSTTRHKT